MIPLSEKEISLRATNFVTMWKDKAQTAREKADAQIFQHDFFDIFGIDSRKVVTFEYFVNMSNEIDALGEKITVNYGWSDSFWEGYIMIEMKSPPTTPKERLKAYHQAKDYIAYLPPKIRPQGILISDFLFFDYYDLKKGGKPITFSIEELPTKINLFNFLIDDNEEKYKPVNPVDIKAAELMGELHDALKENNYTGHELEMYLVRLLFCLFADDSFIFNEKKIFYKYILEETKDDGSDLGMHIGYIFETLNTPEDKRQKNLNESLNKFIYINGGLFKERLTPAAFNSTMRKTLLKCCTLDWKQIKPEIFGAMFQSIKEKDKRRALGEHYTSETNILKVIQPLFLDELWDDFERIKKLPSFGLRQQRLKEFHNKLRSLKFLDPACGCGNFLVVTYREIRLLEVEVLSEYLQSQLVMDIDLLIRVNVDQFYGIEVEEFPARIAETALWLMDHLMNLKASEKFGKYFLRIPLTATPNIIIDNALKADWESVVPKNELSYIMGNPPFLGAHVMGKQQKNELENIFNNLKNCGELDYVTCWYKKAADYIQDTEIECAFVSTNSICQGQQVSILWPELINKSDIKINFAHQTFKWSNEARGNAAVYCVIIGFAINDRPIKKIYQYETVTSEPMEIQVKQINAYLVNFDDLFIISRQKPLCDVPEMNFGNMPLDGGHLLLSDEEKNEFIKIEPKVKKYIKPLISAHEFLNGIRRWCIWLVNVEPSELRKMPEVMKRVEAVKNFRLASIAPSTRDHAVTPSLFRDRNNPNSSIVIPSTSSELRKYIPMGFFDKNYIANNSCHIIPDATLYHFGILTSTMHMAWVRYVCGRLEMRYRYSKDIVYNNFPWPTPTEKQKKEIEKVAQEILDARTKFPNSSLADLYDPITMPPVLLKAHQKLDKIVEKSYGKTFDIDSERIAHLFYLYQNIIEGLFVKKPKKKPLKKGTV
jgi:hypothetical protein